MNNPQYHYPPIMGVCWACYPIKKALPHLYHGNLTIGQYTADAEVKVTFHFAFDRLTKDVTVSSGGEIIVPITEAEKQYFTALDRVNSQVTIETPQGEIIEFTNSGLTLNCLILRIEFACPEVAGDKVLEAFEPKTENCDGCN